MSTRTYKFLIFVSVLAILAVVVGQLLWTSYSQKIIRQASKALIELSISKAYHDFDKIITNKKNAGEQLSTEEISIIIDSVLNAEFGSVKIIEELNYALVCGTEILYKSDTTITDAAVFKSEFMKGFYYEKNKPALMVSVIVPPSLSYHFAFDHLNFWWLISMSGFAVIVFVSQTMLRTIRNVRKEGNTRVRIINNIAHEFKTPIASIKLASEMLLNEEIAKQSDRVHRYAELLLYEIKRLQTQTEQFQNIVLMEEGQIMFRFDYIHVNEIVKNLIRHYILVRADYQDRLIIQMQAADDLVYTDAAHFQNVISNLIDNAFKYGGDNVIVTVSTRCDNEGTYIAVTDNGVGVSKAHQKLIFTRFYRVTPINKHEVQGHGIGLYYVKTILKQMGAEISLHSTFGKGSRFEIYFSKELNNQKK